MKKILIGGSFAPTIDEQKLAEYRTIASAVEDRQAAQYMTDLCDMVELFKQTPDSTESGVPHPVIGVIVPLAQEEIDRIWDAVPWPQECDVIGEVFETLTDPAQRNAAFHLLWYARELSVDREPLTKERIGL